MSERRMSRAEWIVTLVALVHLVGVAIATACLWWVGHWDRSRAGLTLTWRILGGVGIVHALAGVLPRVTIFGWNFRRYFRLDENGSRENLPVRPTRAPWFKSGKVSFTTTLIL